MSSEWKEITSEKYHERLDTMPPVNWSPGWGFQFLPEQSAGMRLTFLILTVPSGNPHRFFEAVRPCIAQNKHASLRAFGREIREQFGLESSQVAAEELMDFDGENNR